jgi:uncharacterized SAM-binding protein YcdF (DUF218 family)
MKEIQEEISIISDFLMEQDSESNLPKSDAIFVFGHIDKRVAEHTGNLFLKNKASKIIISGGIGTAKKDPAGFPSEAEYFSSVIKNMGVPENIIFLENKATNTLENVLFGMKKAQEEKLAVNSVIIVSVPFLLCRAQATFLKHYPDIKIYKSSFSVENIDYNNISSIKRLLAEVDRLDTYAQKGDIAKVQIPNVVREAYSKIKKVLANR